MSYERFEWDSNFGLRRIDGRSWFAILDESGNVLECTCDTWSRWFEHSKQRIIKQEEVNGCFVSTVFVGCDIYFETMIRRDKEDWTWQERADTLADALRSHERAIRAADNLEFDEHHEPLLDRLLRLLRGEERELE